jgi:ribose transport system ATP-binding protein
LETILRLNNIDKQFGSIHALKEITLDIFSGETIALVGENGAGKSTLVKILTGAYHKDSGEIQFNGKPVDIRTPQNAKELGIGQIYQRSELVPEFSVAENVLLGEKMFSKRGFVSEKKLIEKTKNLMERYGILIDVKEKVKNLSVATGQLIAIVKVLQMDPKVIIFDEPTAVLSNNEVEILFRLIRQLQEEQRTVIYISHRLEEVFRVADRIAILRDGCLVSVLKNKNLEKDDLINYMLGRKLEGMYPKKIDIQERIVPILEVIGLTTHKIKNISFHLYKNEILGIAGLVGSGRTELARALYGQDKKQEGIIKINSTTVSKISIRAMIKKGMFLAPEDRRGEGLVLNRSIQENITYSNLNKFSSHGLLKYKQESEYACNMQNQMSIKTPNMEDVCENLSGGNQQKVVLSKALTANPQILIADEPTQGIDVGAKFEIYCLLNKLAASGMSIIFISSEMDELVGLCNRLIVLREGRLVCEIDEAHIHDRKLILNMMYRNKENE